MGMVKIKTVTVNVSNKKPPKGREFILLEALYW